MGIKEDLQQSVLVFDGAMGTYYASLVHTNDTPCELANLADPLRVEQIHRQYIEAGAQAVKTNTFGANTVSLATEWSQVEKVISQGYQIACRAAEDRYVFADIGPIPEATDLTEYENIVDVFFGLRSNKFFIRDVQRIPNRT